jgi:predicted HTH transcriptional regulator
MEGQVIEYKSDIPTKVNQFKAEIVAFLNTNDATIILGVEDESAEPIPEKKEKFREWESLISEWIHSAFNIPVQEFVQMEVSPDSFVIHIQKGDRPPYYYKDGEGFNAKGIYIRKGSSKRRATDEEVRRMLKAQIAHEFESQKAQLDKPLTFHYLQDKLINNDIEFDEKGLRLLDTDKQYNNGALILSEQNPFVTKIAVIDGLDMDSNFLAKKEFSGSLIKQIDMTLEYISLLNDKKVDFTGAPARLESEGYPSKAVRETVINAYAHRDYSLSADIKIEVYDNRMEVFSAGGIPDGLSVLDIKNGISARRNHNIVHVLDKITYMENYASGIRRILASYKDFEKEPCFIVTPNQFKVILYNRHYFSDDKERQNSNNNLKKSLINSEQLELGLNLGTDSNTQEIGVSEQKLDLNDEKIITLLKLNDEMSRREIQSHIQESKTKTYQRLTNLIGLGLIGKRGQSRAVIYYLFRNERK